MVRRSSPLILFYPLFYPLIFYPLHHTLLSPLLSVEFVSVAFAIFLCRSGFVIMLPTAFCFGELVSFTEENLGFLDQQKLHTPLYLSINLFAGDGVTVG